MELARPTLTNCTVTTLYVSDPSLYVNSDSAITC